MFTLALEPTNLCNRNCVHCIRDKLEARKSLSIELADKILRQAKNLGIRHVSITGGEPLAYPYFEELVEMIAGYGLKFNVVTNGFRFKDRFLPLIQRPKIWRQFELVCFSLDGARADIHDAIRGSGSFKEVIEAASLCKLKGIPISLKSVITNLNKSKRELTELALLGAILGAKSHSFIQLFVAPRLIKEGMIPSPKEYDRIVSWIGNSLARTVRTSIYVEAPHPTNVIFSCNAFRGINVDYEGNLIFCCNLSHVLDDGRPANFGKELLCNLDEVPLKEGIVRHFKLLTEFVERRIMDAEKLSGLTLNPCYWCFKYFGKLEWLKKYPESPWAEGVLSV